ncbi:hypothetical protein ACP70R_042650 [Stipagrostis hirtigluma subsp. patula]
MALRLPSSTSPSIAGDGGRQRLSHLSWAFKQRTGVYGLTQQKQGKVCRDCEASEQHEEQNH